MSLTAGEWRLLARAAVALSLARAGLAVVPFDRLHRIVSRIGPASGPVGDEGGICWSVCAVARRLPGTSCLPRSLALLALLRRAGVPAELRIGVQPGEAAGLRAHAWVESRGIALLDEDLAPYRSLGRLPG